MEWKPKKWIAVLLGLFFAPSGFLYVNRPRVAVAFVIAIYISALVAIGVLLFSGISRVYAGIHLFVVFGWAVAIGCGVYCALVAARSEPSQFRAWYTRWYALIAAPLTIYLPVFLFRAFFYEPFYIPSASMYPTIPEGSYVVASKFGFGNYRTFGITVFKTSGGRELHRGDLVIHHLGTNPSVRYIRRVVGLPGDHVVYKSKRLIVNGHPIRTTIERVDGQYEYVTEDFNREPVTVALMQARPPKDYDEVVPQDHYVLYGDNRDNAEDSRYFGMVPKTNVDGLVIKVFTPHE
jgi:signal peptidase I